MTYRDLIGKLNSPTINIEIYDGFDEGKCDFYGYVCTVKARSILNNMFADKEVYRFGVTYGGTVRVALEMGEK